VQACTQRRSVHRSAKGAKVDCCKATELLPHED
jgi:hypothetical protein